jgi:hypothetical protein
MVGSGCANTRRVRRVLNGAMFRGSPVRYGSVVIENGVDSGMGRRDLNIYTIHRAVSGCIRIAEFEAPVSLSS